MAGGLLQRGDLTAGVGQDDAEGDLTGIHEVRHSERMPDLEMEFVPACPSVLPRRADAVEVAVEPVHRGPADVQPTPAVDPRSPLTRTGHSGLGAGHFAGEVFERVNVEGSSVVDAKVEV